MSTPALLSNAQRRAAVLAPVEAKLKDIWPDDSPGMRPKNFDDLEAGSVQAGDAVTRQIMSEALSATLTVPLELRAERCECGNALQWSKKKRAIQTIRGVVTLERDYAYCRKCSKGFFPR